MAMYTPGNVGVSSESQLTLPAMAKQPLKRALENLNYLWKWHRPPLQDTCFTPTSTSHRFVLPVMPSADALTYAFEHRVMPSANANVTITVDYSTSVGLGGWVQIYTTTVAATANTLLVRSDEYTLPVLAVALRITYTTSTGALYPHHVLITPAPGDATTGIKDSGAVLFDDGQLNLAGATVHTEYVNRCKETSLAILRDRWQCCLSFAQTY